MNSPSTRKRSIGTKISSKLTRRIEVRGVTLIFGRIFKKAKNQGVVIEHAEYSVMRFTAISLCVLAVLVLVLKWLWGNGHPDGPKELVEVAVSILNFVGVMYISRGVILLRNEARELRRIRKNPKAFSEMGTDLFLGASRCCEIGSLVVLAALAVDLIVKCVM